MRAKRVHQLRKENGLTKDDKGKMRKIKKLWNMISRNLRASSLKPNE